jgi:hypothetical protein
LYLVHLAQINKSDGILERSLKVDNTNLERNATSGASPETPKQSHVLPPNYFQWILSVPQKLVAKARKLVFLE